MTTNSIFSNLQTNATAQAPTANLSSKADAWRKAFEKEQAGILKDTKSVKYGASNTGASANNASSTLHFQHENEVRNLSNLIPHTDTEQSASAMNGKKIAGNAQNIGTYGQESTTMQSLSLFQNIQQAVARNTLGSHLQNGQIVSAIAVFESHYKQKWPLKNVHVLQNENEISIWIRDASMAEGSEQIKALVERLQQAVQDDGKKLVSLALNGKAILG